MELALITQARQFFGAELRRLRTEKRLTLQDLQLRSGVNYAAISAIESGKRPAGDAIAAKLADGLRLDRQPRSEFLEAASKTTLNSHQMHTAAQLGSCIISQAQILGINTDHWQLGSLEVLSPSRVAATLVCDVCYK